MDYLLRDSLYCGVRTAATPRASARHAHPGRDPCSGEWGIGLEEGGVHAVEARVMARYYMFTQVYST